MEEHVRIFHYSGVSKYFLLQKHEDRTSGKEADKTTVKKKKESNLSDSCSIQFIKIQREKKKEQKLTFLPIQ